MGRMLNCISLCSRIHVDDLTSVTLQVNIRPRVKTRGRLWVCVEEKLLGGLKRDTDVGRETAASCA